MEVVEIQDPLAIVLGGAAAAVVEEVAAAQKRLEEVRPFSTEATERLQRAMLPERIVATLNMEGIRATQRQTLAIMDAMRVRDLREQGEVEVANALRADEFVQDLVEREVELTEQVPRRINGLLLEGIEGEAGRFRRGPVELPGAPMVPPAWTDVPDLVRRMVDGFRRADMRGAVLQACWVHAQFTMIHPFRDGNGRTGRLLQDFALVRRGLLPVGVPAARRDDYYNALADADEGRWDALVETIGMLELDSIARTERVVREPEEREAWIGRLSAAAAKKQRDTRHKRYLVWRHNMEGVVREFCEAARDLDKASNVIGATAKAFDVVDFPTWQDICARGYAHRTWLFSLLFFADGRPFYRLIFYLRRHRAKPYDLFENRRDLVAVYVTGLDAAEARPTFGLYRDVDVGLREFVFVDSNLYCFTGRGQGEREWECRDDLTAAEVVRELFEDVFVRKGGVEALD